MAVSNFPPAMRVSSSICSKTAAVTGSRCNYRSSTIALQEIPMSAIHSVTKAATPYPHNMSYVPVDAVLTWSKPAFKPRGHPVVYFG